MIFGVGSLAGVLLVPYSTYAKYLKWLTISLFAYVGVVFFAHVSWPAVIRATLLPHIELTKGYLMALVAVLGTTISPYLFFWQASQEVEEVRNNHGEKPLKRAPSQAQEQLKRIRVDTYLGMALSNLVAFFIILTAAATLHVSGITGNLDLRPGGQGIGAACRPFCIPAVSSAVSSAPDCWRFQYWRRRRATELARPAAGKRALNASLGKRSGFTRL